MRQGPKVVDVWEEGDLVIKL